MSGCAAGMRVALLDGCAARVVRRALASRSPRASLLCSHCATASARPPLRLRTAVIHTQTHDCTSLICTHRTHRTHSHSQQQTAHLTHPSAAAAASAPPLRTPPIAMAYRLPKAFKPATLDATTVDADTLSSSKQQLWHFTFPLDVRHGDRQQRSRRHLRCRRRFFSVDAPLTCVLARPSFRALHFVSVQRCWFL